LRATHLAEYNRDQNNEDTAGSIDKAWETFRDHTAHDEFWKQVRETDRLDKLQAAYARSFDKSFLSMTEMNARNILAKELTEKLRLNADQHEKNTENQLMEIMMGGGIKDGKPLPREEFIKHLQVFAGSLPKLRPGDGFSRQAIAAFLTERDDIIRKCNTLVEKGPEYITDQEKKHKKSFTEIIRSEQHPGIWSLYKPQYKAYKVVLKEREEADKKAAQEKAEAEAQIKERDDEIARLKELLAAKGDIQASVGGADGGQAAQGGIQASTGGDGAAPQVARASGKRNRTATTSPRRTRGNSPSATRGNTRHCSPDPDNIVDGARERKRMVSYKPGH
jgi:hypothetical protein